MKIRNFTFNLKSHLGTIWVRSCAVQVSTMPQEMKKLTNCLITNVPL